MQLHPREQPLALCLSPSAEGTVETGESATGSCLVRQLEHGLWGFVLTMFDLFSREVALATLGQDPAHTAMLPHKGVGVVWEVEGGIESFRRHMERSSLDAVPAAEESRKYKRRRPGQFVDIVFSRLLYLVSAAALVWTQSTVLISEVVLVVPAGAVGVVLDPRRPMVGDPGHASPTASEGRNICDLHCSYLSVIGGSLCLVHDKLCSLLQASNGCPTRFQMTQGQLRPYVITAGDVQIDEKRACMLQFGRNQR